MPALRAPIVVDLEYEDAKGNVSDRRVAFFCKEISEVNTYLHGWCHDFDDERSFREDRILSATDEDGADIEPIDLTSMLPDGTREDIPEDYYPDDFDDVEAVDDDESSNEQPRNPIFQRIVEFYWGVSVIHSAVVWYNSGIASGFALFTCYCVFGWIVSRWWKKANG